MTKVDQLIEKFKEFKEELNKACPCGNKTDCGPSCPCPKGCKCKKDSLKKNMNGSMNPGMHKPNMTTGTSGGQGGMYRSEMNASPGGAQDMQMIKWDKNGQWKLDKVDPQENINIPHPQGKAKMANGVNKDESYISKEGKNREANPKLRASDLGPGGKVHMVKDEGTNEEAGTSKPHNKGKFKVESMAPEKESKRAEVSGKPYNGSDKDVHKGEAKGKLQGNDAKGFDENKAPGRGTLTV